MSRKREREADSSTVRLCSLADIEYDREQIDTLLVHYRKAEVDQPSESADMVCCPRAYEESFLREPIGSERECARGRECEGYHIVCENPFALREFIYPGKKPGDTRTLCLLCRRNEIARAYYRYETGHCQDTHNLRITDHFNLVGVPGEYDVRDCIVSSGNYAGIPLPVVLHVRSAYEPHVKDGVRCLTQPRMRFPNSTASEPGSFLIRRATSVNKLAQLTH